MFKKTKRETKYLGFKDPRIFFWTKYFDRYYINIVFVNINPHISFQVIFYLFHCIVLNTF